MMAFEQPAPLVVIAEEQPTIRELLCWMLHQAGYRAMLWLDREAVLSGKGQSILLENKSVVLLLDLSLLATAGATDFLCRVRTRWRDYYTLLPQIIVLTLIHECKQTWRAESMSS